MLCLLVGDIHITGKSPISRLDDFSETQFIKLNEIKDLANKHNCPIISVGDFFHTPIVSYSLVNKVGEILNDLNNYWFVCWGNHDSLYHSEELQNRTSLGTLLINNPNIRHISEFIHLHNESWDYQDWDCELTNGNKNSKYLLIHKAVISKKQSDSNFWIAKDKTFSINVKELEEYKIIICGHWHVSYSFKYKNTMVINPGAVSRLTVEDNFHPSVVLLNLKTGIFKRHYLESALPYEDVISAKHLKSKENNSENIKKFISAIQKKGSNHDSAFMDNLMTLIDNHELDKEMEELLIDILAKTKERNNK